MRWVGALKRSLVSFAGFDTDTAQMADIVRCNRCGNLLPSGAPEGTCPACMLRAGLAPGSEPTTAAGWPGENVTFSFEPAQPGHVLESLARSMGTIPRVLLPDTAADETELAIAKPSSDEMPAPAERGGRYQLFGEIARGGMGAVLKGRDHDLGRDLAVKVLLERHEDKPEMLRRFVEAQLVALQKTIEAGLDAARRDKALIGRLVDIRSAEADDRDGSVTDHDYAGAFREAGIDLASLTPAEAGAKIRARSPSVALALARALDDWAATRRGKRATRPERLG